MTVAGAPHDSEAELAATCRLFNRRPKGIRVDCRVSIQVRRDVLKVRAQPGSIDQAAGEHFAYVFDVLCVAAFDLRQRLRIEIEMMERHAAFARHERTAILPTWLDGNEVVWRGEFDVDVERLFQLRDGPQERIVFRHHARSKLTSRRISAL